MSADDEYDLQIEKAMISEVVQIERTARDQGQ
jgi:hypothetical protein